MDRVYVMELVRSYQCGEMTRRDFLRRATLALGSVAAANTLLAACAPAPTTPPPPVVATSGPTAGAPVPEATGTATGAGETVAYPGPDGAELTGYLSRPAASPAPAVLVIQEWWGIDDHIKDMAHRLAGEGFNALAPDLYHGVVATEPDEARKMVMELDMAAAVAEIRAAVDYLQGLEGVAGPRVGLVGFCMGGRLALQTALVEEDLGAVVSFYGSPLKPEEAPQVKAPILGLYGEADEGIAVADIEAMGQALTDAGVENDVRVYPGAQHAFFNDRRPSYHAEAAADAWPRTLEWFRRHLS